MTTILDGRAIASEIRSEVAAGVRAIVEHGGRPPGLAAIRVGEDPASKVYVGHKVKACQEAGIGSRVVELGAGTTQAELEAEIDALNGDPVIDGILLQLPIPEQLDDRVLLDRIDPGKDVDGFHPVNVGRLWSGGGEHYFRPATPAGVIEMLRRSQIELAGLQAVIVGRSNLVGKPLAGLLLRENCTVTVCHSRTRDLPAVCRGADLLIAAIGRPGMIEDAHVATGAIVVDVGINRIEDASLVERLIPADSRRREVFARNGSLLVGDVDYHAVAERARAITPVPGGVGPLTVAMLLANTLEASRHHQSLP